MSGFAMSGQERADFLADIHVAILAVERDDASPLAVPVWYGVGADGDVLVWTERGTRKERLIRASGRFTLSVQNEAPPYGYVTVAGPATINDNVTSDQIRPIVERYVSADEVETHLNEAFNDKAVLITMRPAQWYSADYGTAI